MNLVDLKRQLKRAKIDSEKQIIQSQIVNITDKAENHIRNAGRDINYTIREWSIEMIFKKYSDGLETDENELFIPDYQRIYKWSDKVLSRFIESILLDFPIPYLYIADVDSPDDPELDGRIEIIDGSQRIRALHYFVDNQIALTELKEITELEGFKFEDLTASRRRRFLRETVRLVELKGAVDESTRRDLFERINSGVKRLEAMEVRRGSQEASSRFYKEVLSKCAKLELFEKLAPLSAIKKGKADHNELALRFFAYLNDLENYSGYVKQFLDDYLGRASRMDNDEEIQNFNTEFEKTLKFIDKHIELGFKKTIKSKTTARARYEALAVGTALALRESPNLEPAIPVSSWITSEEFQKVVGADSANNTSQLIRRIEFVKEKLLEG